MKKKLLFGMLVLGMCIAMVGCGNSQKKTENTEDVVNDEIVENDEKNVEASLSDYSFDFKSDDKKLVFKVKDNEAVDFGEGYEEYDLVIYYEGEKVTDVEAYVMYESAEKAKLAYEVGKEEIKDDSTITKIDLKGKTIVLKIAGEDFKNVTVSELKTAFAFLSTVYEQK